MSSQVVLFEQLATSNGKKIALARLNVEKTLNSLSLEMVDLLAPKLIQWEQDDDVVLVILEASGEKAFCAGGDLQALYQYMLTLQQDAAEARDIMRNRYAGEFFEREYRLDYHLHTYQKPIMCWGHGIVMGGGMGLLAGASHRVVTDASRLAMPEINIGLFPDVGGTWLLHHTPGKTGLFLGLTAAQLRASDALYAGWADFAIAQANKSTVYEALKNLDWQANPQHNDEILSVLLAQYQIAELEVGPLEQHFDLIDAACDHANLDDVVEAILGLPNTDEWITKAQNTLRKGAPSSARLTYALQEKAPNMSLAEIFRVEYIVALHCAAHNDFQEGIRALLIDKDQSPKWSPASIALADQAFGESFFVAGTWAEHPLSDLN